MGKKNEVAVVENSGFNFPVVDEEMQSAIMEDLDGLTMEFDRVKIPSGGGLAFEVPGDDPDDPDLVKVLEGVIVDHYPINTYYENEYTGEGNPPDCASMDGKTGTHKDSGDVRCCDTCPLNQFGSGKDGLGKACKNQHRVYLLREDEAFPLLITLPPTSKKNFSNFMAKRIVGKGKRSYGVITKISLTKDKNAGGIEYSKAQFAIVESLEPDQVRVAKEYAEGIKEHTRQQSIAVEKNDIFDDLGQEVEVM